MGIWFIMRLLPWIQCVMWSCSVGIQIHGLGDYDVAQCFVLVVSEGCAVYYGIKILPRLFLTNCFLFLAGCLFSVARKILAVTCSALSVGCGTITIWITDGLLLVGCRYFVVRRVRVYTCLVHGKGCGITIMRPMAGSEIVLVRTRTVSSATPSGAPCASTIHSAGRR